MKILTKKQVLMLHGQLVEETGGSAGLRDDGLLESALSAPFQSFAGTDMFPSIQQKAARLAHVMLVFLAINGIELEYKQSELSDIFLAVAAGTCEYENILQWILDHELND